MGNEMSNELRSICLLNSAKNWNDFCDAMKTFTSISQNVDYADTKGNIGMYCCAGIPIRKGDPVRVLPGETSAYDWHGIVPFDQLPHKYNPSEGFAVSANNRTIDKSFPYYISNWFDLPFRFDRITEMLKVDRKLSIGDMAAIQNDFTSKQVQYYLPNLVETLKKQPGLKLTEKTAISILEKWEGKMDAKNPAPAIFEVFFTKFIENALKDELGEDLFKEFLVDKVFVRNTLYNLWRNKKSVLFDDITTTNKTETFDDIVLKSFHNAISELEEKEGHDATSWKWGKLHTFTLEHPLGKVKILDIIFHLNRGPYETNGSYHTVSYYGYRYTNPYKVQSGASQRHIYDLSNWDNSLSILPTGNSGIPSSKHFCDQTSLYLAGKYHRDLFSRNIIEKNCLYKTIISPFKKRK